MRLFDCKALHQTTPQQSSLTSHHHRHPNHNHLHLKTSQRAWSSSCSGTSNFYLRSHLGSSCLKRPFRTLSKTLRLPRVTARIECNTWYLFFACCLLFSKKFGEDVLQEQMVGRLETSRVTLTSLASSKGQSLLIIEILSRLSLSS